MICHIFSLSVFRRTKIAEAAAARRERGKLGDPEAELAKMIQEAKQGLEAPSEARPDKGEGLEEDGLIVLDD